MQSAWKQIAHERVQERLDGLFFRISLYGISLGASGDAYREYSEQEKRSRNSTSKVASRELENAVLALENTVVQKAFEVYKDEAPERPIQSRDLLWAIYNFGLVPFIETKVLNDICYRLDLAQPSLNLNLSRSGADHFFTYNSPRLRKDFPVVIRIVDGLKRHWYDEIGLLAGITNAEVPAVSTGGLSDNRPQSGKNVPGTPVQTIKQPAPDSQPSQSLLQPRAESMAPIESESELGKADLQEQGARDLPPSVEQPISGTTKQKNATGKTARSTEAAVPRTDKWPDIEILFLSDDRVQIHIRKKPAETLNYAEFGFMNQTTKNPSAAWIALRQIAELNGAVRTATEARVPWVKFEKRVQEIRRVLRKYFQLDSDPILYVEHFGYRAHFKISCGPSFRR